MAEIGIGIIGTGSIVKTYVKCIGELKGARLVALYTKSAERIQEAKKMFGAPVLDDLGEFLSNPDIDLVCVCNESGNHGWAIEESARAGKHVLSEKPLETTPEKIDRAIEACHIHKVKLGCVFQNRCAPEYRAVEQVVREGSLGRLLMGNAHINWYRSEEYYARNPWRGTLQFDGGAAFINQGIHTVDLLLNLMGPVESVFGNVRTMVHDIEGEDVGMGMVTFNNGAIGTVTAGTALFPGYPERLEVYGQKGSILMEGGKITQWNVPGTEAPSWESKTTSEGGASDPTKIGHGNHKAVLTDMIGAITSDRPPMVDGEKARIPVALITALYQSSKEERSIYL